MPAKQVSSAVNRVTGENASRHVNGHRLHHAMTLLRRGDSVTAAMLSSGFSTKPNFNREFRRVTGTAPSTIRDHPAETEPPTLRLGTVCGSSTKREY